jgi:hypothetical protein
MKEDVFRKQYEKEKQIPFRWEKNDIISDDNDGKNNIYTKYIYIYVNICIYMHIYIHIHI